MCKKQTSVSNSSTDSEIISLDAGLRMDGLLALDLWDIVIEVLRSTNNNVQPKHTSIQETDALYFKTKTQRVKRRQKIDQLIEVDYVPTNTHTSQNESPLYIFEDNEAVIKMTIKGRSPTMRHGSRTHRVALDWLFERNNLEPKIQIKYVNTKNTNSSTFSPKEVSREMSGIICCACSISAISVLQFVLKQWRKDFNKIQEKNESQQNHDQ